MEHLFETPNDVEEWRAKLIGKTLVEGDSIQSEQQFPTSQLPQGNRVLSPGMPQTKDYVFGRLNVFVDDKSK